MARGLGRAEDRLLDLLGRRRRIERVIDAHVNGAVALAAQPRHQSSAQQRSLAEAGLAEQHRQELALNAGREFRGFLVTAVKIGATLLGVGGKPEPRVLGIDAQRADRAGSDSIHARRPFSSSCSLRSNSGPGWPPGARVMCSARNFSGTSASDSGVWSIHTG